MKALVLGGAANMMADAEGALKLFDPDVIVAVNDAGIVWPGKIDHWVTLHPTEFPRRVERRRARGFDMKFEAWSHESRPWIDHVRCYWEGSSGMFGARAAIELGGLRVVLAGIPMDDLPHVRGGVTHERLRGKAWPAAKKFRDDWQRCKPYMGAVRSMSGWTKHVLGAPDEKWLRLS